MNAYPDARYVGFKATYELVDSEAAGDASLRASSEEYGISKLAQINEPEEDVTHRIETLELNHFILSGNAEVMPINLTDSKVGWWSDSISDGSCNIDETLTISFGNAHDSVGLTLFFDGKAEEAARSFSVSFYDALDGLISTANIDNLELNRAVDLLAPGYTKIVIHFTKTVFPYHRIKLSNILFGIIQNFDRNTVKEASILREISFDALAESELEMVIDNSERKYNMLNPEGFYAYLQQAQPLDVSIGVGESRDSLEWAYIGRFYYTKAETTDSSITAKITAHSIVKFLENIPCSIFDETATDTIGNLLDEVLSLTGLAIEAVVPEDVAAIPVYRKLEEQTVREAITRLADAGMCMAYIDKDERLIFTKLEENASLESFTSDIMHSYPVIKVPEYKDGAFMQIGEVEYSCGGDHKLAVNNPLVTPDRAADYLAWKVTVSQLRKYELRYRGNPERNAADVIQIFDYFHANRNAVITKSSMKYDGGLTEDIVCQEVMP